MSGFRFGLYAEDGDDLGVFQTVVPNWSPGDEFLMDDGRRFGIVAIITDAGSGGQCGLRP